MSEHPSRLILAIDVPAELEGGEALDGVHAQHDRGAEVDEGHLAGGENRPDVTENWWAQAARLNLRRPFTS